ncbi:type VI secretion system lipoprotein TssJ [Sphingomonas sp. NCPPB 2930]
MSQHHRSFRRSAVFLTLPLLSLAWLAGCTWTPRPVMPSQLDITVTASADSNADTQGRAAPVMVRVYELRTADAFERADFFTLNDKDQSVLGEDLVHRDEFVLQPGQSRQVARTASNETRAIGVMVAYRAIDSSAWRATARVLPPVEAGRVFSGRPLQQRYLAQVAKQGVALYSVGSAEPSLPMPNLPTLNLPSPSLPSLNLPTQTPTLTVPSMTLPSMGRP